MTVLESRVLNGVLEIGRGLWTVAKHAFRPPVTLEYPEAPAELSPRFHGRLSLLTKSSGEDLCIGCMACARVCPCDDLIQIEMHRDDAKKPVIDMFTIDMGRCIVCGMCEEACPVDAIAMSNVHVMSSASRASMTSSCAATSR